MIAASALSSKIRWRLIAPTILFMLLSSLDRVNISFAALRMNAELGFSPSQYGFGAGILFLGFLAGQYPSVLLLQRIGMRRWIAACAILWGCSAGAMAFIESHTYFYMLRVLLGFAESGLAPGIVIYLSQFATERERATTFAMPMLAIPLSIVIGGPISGWLMGMDVAGMSSWRWMFIAEAMPTIALGIAAYFYFPDRPADAGFLTPDEKVWLEANAANRDDGARKNDWSVLAWPVVWMSALLWFCLLSGAYGIMFWLPQMVKQLSDLTPFQIGLVNALPWIGVALGIYFNSAHSDRTGERFWHVGLPAVLTALAILAASSFGAGLPGLAALFLAGLFPGRRSGRLLGASDLHLHAPDVRGRCGRDQHRGQFGRACHAASGRNRPGEQRRLRWPHLADRRDTRLWRIARAPHSLLASQGRSDGDGRWALMST
jgi:MFS family permease